MSIQAVKIPVGRPQPKLSRLLAQQALAPEKQAFWDLQQTPLPGELCALPSAVLETLCSELGAARLTVVTEVPASTELGADLLRALNATKSVHLLSFLQQSQNGQASGRAAEYELKRVSHLQGALELMQIQIAT